MGSQQRELSWVVPESATRQSQAEISKSTQPAEAEVSHVNGILGEQNRSIPHKQAVRPQLRLDLSVSQQAPQERTKLQRSSGLTNYSRHIFRNRRCYRVYVLMWFLYLEVRNRRVQQQEGAQWAHTWILHCGNSFWDHVVEIRDVDCYYYVDLLYFAGLGKAFIRNIS